MVIGLLASGDLGLITAQQIKANYTVSFIATDRNSAVIADWVTANGIPCFIGNPRSGKLAAFISDYRIDLILSINYLYIVEKEVTQKPDRYAINIHGSLLPKYR